METALFIKSLKYINSPLAAAAAGDTADGAGSKGAEEGVSSKTKFEKKFNNT